MSSFITPSPLVLATPIAPQALLINNRISGQLDLRNYWGAMINVTIARISTVAYVSVTGASGGIDFICNRQFLTLGSTPPTSYSIVGGNSNYSVGNRTSSLTASGSITRQVSTANSLGDTQIITKTSNTGSTQYASTLAFIGSTAPGSLTNTQSVPTLEVARLSSFASTGPWTIQLAQPLGYVHAINDYVTDAAEQWDIWLPGNYVYNLMFDANSISAGAGAVVQCIANLYESDVAT